MTTSSSEKQPIPDSPQSSRSPQGRVRLKEEITEFLATASSTRAQGSACPHCGREMQYVDTTFSLYGGGSTWQVRLPVCSCAAASVRDLAQNTSTKHAA